MIPQTLPQRPGSGFLTSKALGHLGGWICGAAVLYWVALQAGPRAGTAIVHVTEPHVVVNVGSQTFSVGASIHAPLVCDLPAGEHRLTMTRGATVLYAETFSIVGGEEYVLTTWKAPPEAARREPRPSPWTEGSARGGHVPSSGGNPGQSEATSYE